MCQRDIVTRNRDIMKYKNKVFTAGAWAEEWYHLNYGNLKGSSSKEQIYAGTKVIPEEFAFETNLENDTIYISKENSRNLNLKSQQKSRNIFFIIDFPSCTSFINSI
jgi:hypothetical protein